MRKEECDIYRGSARKMKRRFDLRQYPMEVWHVSCVINGFRTTCQGGHSSRVHIETVTPWTSNRHPLDFEMSSPGLLTVIPWTLNRHLLNLELSPHGSFRSKVMDLWGEGATKEDKTLGWRISIKWAWQFHNPWADRGREPNSHQNSVEILARHT